MSRVVGKLVTRTKEEKGLTQGRGGAKVIARWMMCRSIASGFTLLRGSGVYASCLLPNGHAQP